MKGLQLLLLLLLARPTAGGCRCVGTSRIKLRRLLLGNSSWSAEWPARFA